MASKNFNFQGENYSINYNIYGEGEEILILHGWGANKEIMQKAFLKQLSDFKLIFIDMPGFGKSSVPARALKTTDYCDIINEFLKLSKLKPVAIMGHSFGGKVATLMRPKILILLSSAGILNKKSLAVMAKIKSFKLLKRLGLGRFYRIFATKDADNLSRQMYETLKNVVNEDFSEIFENCNSKTLIFWGKADRATPLENGKKIANLIENSEFYEYEGDHFFFLSARKKISEIISQKIKENLANSKDEKGQKNA